MNRSVLVVLAVVACCAFTNGAQAAQRSCDAEEYAVNYSQRQVTIAQNRLFQKENSYQSLQNRVDSRVLSLQLQVDQAQAWRQAAAGMSLGNTVGCSIRTIFWGGGRCFANSLSQIIRYQARANSFYQLAVNRLTTYQNSAATSLSRSQQQVAQAQIQYDTAVTRFRLSEEAYLKCLAEQGQQKA
jgi:hypothetical protein